LNIVQRETPAAEPTPLVTEEASELPDQINLSVAGPNTFEPLMPMVIPTEVVPVEPEEVIPSHLKFQAAFMYRRKVRVTLEKLPDGDGEIFREALAR